MNCVTPWLQHPCKNTLVTSITYLKNQIVLHLLDQSFSALKSVLHVKRTKHVKRTNVEKKKKRKNQGSSVKFRMDTH